MDKFPQMLYRFPGSESVHGVMLGTLIVNDEDELAQALEDGWHETSPDAVAAHRAAQDAAAQTAQATATSTQAPRVSKITRDDLEAQATELGIAFDHNVSDKKLKELIATKRAEQSA